MAFREIGDEFHQQAGEAIRSARTGSTYSEYDGAEYVAAGAALALERGAPRLIAQSYDIGADSYLNQGSQAWRKLHSAVAHFVETDLNESEAIASRGDGVKMVVSHVMQAESARKVVMAAGNKDFEDMLNPSQHELMKMARENQGFLRDLSSISVGSFDRLSPEMADSLKGALSDPVPGKLGQEVSLMSRAVDGIVDREEALDERMRFAEGAQREFLPISDTYREQVQAFHRDDTSTGVDAVDAAMTLLKQEDKIPENLHPNDPIMIAQARLLQESMVDVSQAPAALASMALSDAAIMTEARKEFLQSDMMPGIDSDIRGQGEYHLLGENEQARIERDIVYAMKTPAIDKVKLEVGMLENSGIAALDRAHTARMQQGMDPALVDEVAKAAGAINEKYPDAMDPAFVDMGNALFEHERGTRNDVHTVEAAEHLVQFLDDKSMSGSKEWEALSVAVDKARGLGEDGDTMKKRDAAILSIAHGTLENDASVVIMSAAEAGKSSVMVSFVGKEDPEIVKSDGIETTGWKSDFTLESDVVSDDVAANIAKDFSEKLTAGAEFTAAGDWDRSSENLSFKAARLAEGSEPLYAMKSANASKAIIGDPLVHGEIETRETENRKSFAMAAMQQQAMSR